jgi:cysteinyl-tRNA synthetase
LSRRSRADMIAGARVEVAPYKEDPGDFVLWKPSNPDQPGWNSPWGRGRPGWHIECSAMCENTLGETLDIHGGGLDLVFPHHENEIAQSVCAHDGRPFARYWMHNGMLTVGGAKMAKSEGNFITVHDALGKAPAEIIRFALLMTHYRDPLDWTQERLLEAEAIHGRLYRALVVGGFDLETESSTTATAIQPVVDALSDDLNTYDALNCLRALTDAIYKTTDASERRTLKGALRRGGSLLGILGRKDLSNWLNPILDPDVASRIYERAAARQKRNFAEADHIRAELAAEGIILEDKPDGTTTWWRKD